jgi:putative toxin-antitoxin system antitoxin component (TIGR02293 family)
MGNAARPIKEKHLVKILGGKANVKKPIQSNFDLIHLSQDGVTRASVEALMNYIGVSKKQFTEDILDISIKTLERKKVEEKFDKRTSSHVIEIAKLVEHALTVFEDEEKTRRWLNQENKALNNKKPIDLFDTLTGLMMVNDVLGRIEEGVYS